MRYGAKLTVERAFRIDIRQLKAAGYLCGFHSGTIKSEGDSEGVWFAISTDDEFPGGKYIWFKYSIIQKNGEIEKYDYKVPLSVTKCHFGGVRYWFLCYANLRHCCGNRVTTLYLGAGANVFACRHCHDLSYNSRNKDRRNSLYPVIEKCRIERERNKIILAKGYRAYYDGNLTRKGKRVMKMNKKIEQCYNYPIFTHFSL